jgi:pyridoxine 5-phosphate synthase
MLLGVNVDHVATIRQARRGIEPDPVMAATLAILGGADGITIHLREDRRHIQERDVKALKELVPVELNLEMAATKEMISIARNIKPNLVTFVPEKRRNYNRISLDVKTQKRHLGETIKKIKGSGIPVSLFINPDGEDISLSKQLGADMVEIHTGMYANAAGPGKDKELARVSNSVKHALNAGLLVNAGHGLNYFNVSKVVAIQGLRGLYIGHSIVSRALFIGIERAVRGRRICLLASQCYNI